MSKSVLFLCEYLLQSRTCPDNEVFRITRKQEKYRKLQECFARFLQGNSCIDCLCASVTNHGGRNTLSTISSFLPNEFKIRYDIPDVEGDDVGVYDMY